jgi:protein-disulfide isomerase
LIRPPGPDIFTPWIHAPPGGIDGRTTVSKRSEKRREARGDSSGGGGINRLYWVLGAVAVLAVAIFGYTLGTSGTGTAATSPVELPVMENEELVAMAQGVTQGGADAPITIVEFGDYQCPGCGAFALQVKPQVELNFVQSGEARFIYYDFPLVSIHPHAFLAARAARCAGDQELFWEYHATLFRNQSTWSAQQSVMGSFLDYAEEVGADVDAFEACLKSDRHADVVTANMRLGEQLGITGTPTVMINGGDGARRLANFDFASIRRVVEDLQGEAGEGS